MVGQFNVVDHMTEHGILGSGPGRATSFYSDLQVTPRAMRGATWSRSTHPAQAVVEVATRYEKWAANYRAMVVIAELVA